MKRLLFLACFAAGLVNSTSAQNGVIIGKVVDEHGCAIYGADVEVRSQRGKLLAILCSSPTGTFEIMAVSDGNYEVSAKDTRFNDRPKYAVYIDKTQRKDSLIFRFRTRSQWGLKYAQVTCDTITPGLVMHCISRISFGPNPAFFNPSSPGNETTILAEDLERMPR